MTTVNNISKTELHCHLDGSVSIELIQQLAREQQVNINIEDIQVDQACESLDEYLKSFDTILKVLQTKGSLEKAVIDVAQQSHHDNIKYIEIRFAPLFHMDKGLNLKEILEAVNNGATKAESLYQIKVNMLVCGMRHHENKTNIDLFTEVNALKNETRHVVGFDFAGPEEAFPTSAIQEAIQYSNHSNSHLTLHAGECGCIHNIIEGIELGARRIGHGVAAISDDTALEYIKNRNVLLEICPTSNLQTKAIQTLAELNIRKLIEQDIPFNINTDNRTVSSTNLNTEYELLYNHNLMTIDEIKDINIKAIEHAFLSDNEKENLKSKY
ncbi:MULTISPECIES: adenosine deaminase [Mammaliicoccus]|uniref:adenosine deaminase n=1 Tax=Mammaliicoccus TaxID=2803850 RepID=UPI000D1D1E23|nr:MULTISPECIES: adenosine deaminase [Mammaliicoccus]PTI38554.1 adenosine deaminase [Mammaliicoccus vitulinus]PTI72684.1 adenosine deaminase [Mammaliicoccus vitulinus]PTI90501.1 adenosine deaminase [Mammaliicoccus vitulinus]QQT14918.1 adenosine deaminase [Mammaliicoccus vitulinus]QQY19790.1 adenosine deaminase [Mammaliicoccus vitulinus]